MHRFDDNFAAVIMSSASEMENFASRSEGPFRHCDEMSLEGHHSRR